MFVLAAARSVLFAAAGLFSLDAAAGGDQPSQAATTAAALIQRAHLLHLADSRDWQVLLHYRRTFLGGWRSEAEGMDFFLSGSEGKTEPQAELDATVAALVRSTPEGDRHPQCRFPARWNWLKKALNIAPDQVRDQSCPTFDGWRTGISANAATLVYATAYLNSPASMYGHTFIRLSRATGEGNPLLDYVVNFAADVDTDNGLLYAAKGLAGLFPGRFYVMPYYVKVQEYTNMESRDLWEYSLTLSPEQIDRLVMHAWETRSTHFPYYFFTRNCSYQLLSLLEAAAPELRLTDQFSGPVIPVDTVRTILMQPGLVTGRAQRPSLTSVMRRRQEELTDQEFRAVKLLGTSDADHVGEPAPTFESAASTLGDAGALPSERQALVMDAAYDYLRYREGLRGEPSDAFKARERQLLLARGRLGVPPQEVVATPELDAPENGHATLRIGTGGGISNQSGGFETLSIRGALHDYLDPDHGYPEDARLEMLDLHLRLDNQRRALRLDRLDGIDIVSAAPIESWARGMSWKVWLGADNARELNCERPGSDHAGWRCLYAGLITGGGFAARFGPQRRILFLLLGEAEVGAGPAFSEHHSFRLGGGGEAIMVGNVSDRWRIELGARAAAYVLGMRETNLRGRIAQSFMLTRWLGVRTALDTAGSYSQVGADLVAYL